MFAHGYSYSSCRMLDGTAMKWLVAGTMILGVLATGACGERLPAAAPTPRGTSAPVTNLAPAGPGTVKLDASVGAPPPAGWKWVAAELRTGTGESADGPHDHSNNWLFFAVKGSTMISTADQKRVVSEGEAALIPARQEHSHRFLPNSHILAIQLRAADRASGDVHRGKLLFDSDSALTVAIDAAYILRLREFTVSPGQSMAATGQTAPMLGYVIEGTLTIRAGESRDVIQAGNIFTVPVSTNQVESNEGSKPLRFVLVDLHR